MGVTNTLKVRATQQHISQSTETARQPYICCLTLSIHAINLTISQHVSEFYTTSHQYKQQYNTLATREEDAAMQAIDTLITTELKPPSVDWSVEDMHT